MNKENASKLWKMIQEAIEETLKIHMTYVKK